MKVEGPKRGEGVSKGKKTSSSGGDVNFSAYVTGGASETVQASTTQSIAQLDILLAAQAVENPADRAAKKRVRVRAENILAKLEEVRIAMLGNNLTVGHMIDVADVVASHRDKIHDPVMTALIDEIDLRAQVEIAKMRYAIENARNGV